MRLASASASLGTLAILRIAAASMMLAKSAPGLLHGTVGVLAILMTALAVLVLLGLAARIAAAGAAVLMVVIYSLFHAPHGLSPVDNGGVPAILSAAMFLHVAVAGPGRWSIDGARKR